MGVELTVRIASPLDTDDREILAGMAVMLVAIANHGLAEEPTSAPDTEAEPSTWPSSAFAQRGPKEPVQ